jgi:hypothetical protein
MLQADVSGYDLMIRFKDSVSEILKTFLSIKFKLGIKL